MKILARSKGRKIGNFGYMFHKIQTIIEKRLYFFKLDHNFILGISLKIVDVFFSTVVEFNNSYLNLDC